jgi:hypothetical protein
LVVRIGEKRVLEKYRAKVSEMIKTMEAPQVRETSGGLVKRKANGGAGGSRKKHKEMR